MGALTGEAAFLYKQAQLAKQERRYWDAVEIFEMLANQHPGDVSIKVELAQSYTDGDRPVKAIEVWDELCRMDPGNSVYSFELARAYSNRGWRLKAIAQYERTLELEPGDPEAWAELIKCHEDGSEWDDAGRLAFEAMDNVTERSARSVPLYVRALDYYSEAFDMTAAESCLATIIEIIRGYGQEHYEILEPAIDELIYIIRWSGYAGFLPYVDQIAELLLVMDGALRGRLDDVKTTLEFLVLEQDGYAEMIVELLIWLSENDGSRDHENNIMAIESSILSDIEGYIPHIKRLKAERPDIFSRHSEFFNSVLGSIDPGALLRDRLRKLSNRDLEPSLVRADGSSPEYVSQGTYKREGPKVGRNDPCPCGSGKKYKKCCGA